MRKEESASTTVTHEIVMITAAIEAQERRDVSTIDITGSYLHTDTDNYIIMILEGGIRRDDVKIRSKTIQELYHHEQ